MHELPPEHFDGVSLLPWLLGQSPPSAFHAHLYWHGLLGDVAVQAGGWKLRRSQVLTLTLTLTLTLAAA